MAMPRQFTIHTTGREVGRSIATRIGSYERQDPRLFHAIPLLSRLFPYDWDPSVPQVYGGTPLVWNRYAQHDAGGLEVNVVLQADSSPSPDGFRLVASDSGASLWVRDDGIWKAQAALRPPSPAGSPFLAVDRSTLFRSVPRTGGAPIISVVETLGRLGIDIDPVLARLHVKR
jgi:hypothetical protein